MMPSAPGAPNLQLVRNPHRDPGPQPSQMHEPSGRGLADPSPAAADAPPPARREAHEAHEAHAVHAAQAAHAAHTSHPAADPGPAPRRPAALAETPPQPSAGQGAVRLDGQATGGQAQPQGRAQERVGGVPAVDLPRHAPAAAPEVNLQQVIEELQAGLMAPRACIPAKFFYDPLGSRLFEAITELPEYYLTRTEAAIFARHAVAMARLMPQGMTLVDLGAGNCRKAASLLPVFKPARYVAVDISAGFLAQALEALQARHPDVPMQALAQDFSRRLQLDAAEVPGPRVLFYPGSSLGNFQAPEALSLLEQARSQCTGGGLLLGVDLLKPAELMQSAYDDALGVTAAFNLNILRHVNRRLGSDFHVADWRHCAEFNPRESCMEMHLVARRALQVRWPGGGRRFAAGERIHTERSHKWTLPALKALLANAGFALERTWQDDRGWFAVCWARA